MERYRFENETFNKFLEEINHFVVELNQNADKLIDVTSQAKKLSQVRKVCFASYSKPRTTRFQLREAQIATRKRCKNLSL